MRNLVQSRQPAGAPRVHPPLALMTDLPGTARAAGLLSDYVFLHLLTRYRTLGGLARAAQVVTRLERGMGLDANLLPAWRFERRVICFAWHAELWLPWFQFLHADGVPDPAVSRIVAQLTSVFDGAEIALWFGTPNSALAGHAPAEMIDILPEDVHDAACRACLR